MIIIIVLLALISSVLAHVYSIGLSTTLFVAGCIYTVIYIIDSYMGK